jgi:thiosulfate reductase cytochrome b subunit
MQQKLAQGMSWHFPFAFVFAVNGILYVGFLIFSGQWRYLAPERRSIRDAAIVILHDIKIHKGELPPQVKYNGAQRFAYTAVLLLGFGSLVTGLAIYKPVQLGWLASLLGGYEAARFEHFLLTLAFVAFFFVHIAQVVRAGWNSFRAMITGLERRNLEKRDVE